MSEQNRVVSLTEWKLRREAENVSDEAYVEALTCDCGGVTFYVSSAGDCCICEACEGVYDFQVDVPVGVFDDDD